MLASALGIGKVPPEGSHIVKDLLVIGTKPAAEVPIGVVAVFRVQNLCKCPRGAAVPNEAKPSNCPSSGATDTVAFCAGTLAALNNNRPMTASATDRLGVRILDAIPLRLPVTNAWDRWCACKPAPREEERSQTPRGSGHA